MDINDFISNFASQFEDTELSVFKTDTEFKKLDEWSSLMALSVIAMIDEEYDVQLKGDDIRNKSTIEELFDIVKSELNV